MVTTVNAIYAYHRLGQSSSRIREARAGFEPTRWGGARLARNLAQASIGLLPRRKLKNTPSKELQPGPPARWGVRTNDADTKLIVYEPIAQNNDAVEAD